jgi:acetylglutamate/LysW-gamma-L-alpha-aminoadipate kinase
MRPIVIKLGGSAGIDTCSFLEDVARLQEPYVLVHGANVELDTLMRQLGVEPKLVTSSDGQVSRYTDAAAMDLFLMAYCGKANKRIVESLQGLGVNAVGLSGMDGGIALGRRKPRIRVVENGKPRMMDGDFAGSIEKIDVSLLENLLTAGYVPVLTPPALSQDGEAINVDGDKLAMRVAEALRARALLLFSNTSGLLTDIDDPDSSVPYVDIDALDQYLAMAQGRMKKKVLAAAAAVRGGVDLVVLADANRPNPVQAALNGAGTAVGTGR